MEKLSNSFHKANLILSPKGIRYYAKTGKQNNLNCEHRVKMVNLTISK